MNTAKASVLRAGAALCLVVLLGAAGPKTVEMQVADLAPLIKTDATGRALPDHPKALSFKNTLYEAAPMPDEDVAGPPGAVQTEAQLSPKILSPRTLFQGDGYASGSSQQGSLASRKAGAAGLGLSVPVN